MIYDKDGIAYPDYQDKNQSFFNNSGKHDVKQWNVINDHISQFRICLDIGAHVGTSALRYRQHFAKTISFEPIPPLFECLQYNTKEFDNIEIHNVAVSDEDATVKIWANLRNTASSVIESHETKKLIDSRWRNSKREDFLEMPSYDVQARSIDSYNFDEVDFIKIDTEGYNIKPLNGMEETLKRCRPVIQLEREINGVGVNDTHVFLKELGYNLILTIGRDDMFVWKRK